MIHLILQLRSIYSSGFYIGIRYVESQNKSTNLQKNIIDIFNSLSSLETVQPFKVIKPCQPSTTIDFSKPRQRDDDSSNQKCLLPDKQRPTSTTTIITINVIVEQTTDDRLCQQSVVVVAGADTWL